MHVILPIALTNRNDGRGHHWSRTALEKKSLVSILRTLPNPFFGVEFPARLRITRILGKGDRLWDYDSMLRGNWKEIQDAMVDVGWLPDDSPRFLGPPEVSQDQAQRLAGPAILVEIIDPKKPTGENNEQGTCGEVSGRTADSES